MKFLQSKAKKRGSRQGSKSEVKRTIRCTVRTVDCSSAVAEARLGALAVLTIKIKNDSPANSDQTDHRSRRQ